MSFVLSSLSEGLLWSIMAIGVYLTFRILDIADMTAEGDRKSTRLNSSHW